MKVVKITVILALIVASWYIISSANLKRRLFVPSLVKVIDSRIANIHTETSLFLRINLGDIDSLYCFNRIVRLEHMKEDYPFLYSNYKNVYKQKFAYFIEGRVARLAEMEESFNTMVYFKNGIPTFEVYKGLYHSSEYAFGSNSNRDVTILYKSDHIRIDIFKYTYIRDGKQVIKFRKRNNRLIVIRERRR